MRSVFTSYLALALTGFALASSFACATPEQGAPSRGLVEQETGGSADPEAELDEIQTRLEAVKAQLFDRGQYNCCIQPPCDWCALHEGSCACLSNLLGGDAVCPDCGLGWHNGQGIAEGIDPASVKWNITHEHPAAGHQR
ncbi:MAG: hypothetical protein ACRD1X_21395 [Vicinamibacteria bacterium]